MIFTLNIRFRAAPVAALLVAALAWAIRAPAAPDTNSSLAAAGDSPVLVKIAVVRDGPCPFFDSLTQKIEEELAHLSRDQFQAVFSRQAAFDAGWDLARVPAALQSALDDPAIDVVLAAGALVSRAAGRPAPELGKPVVSAYAADADLLDASRIRDGRPAKTNFSFVTRPIPVKRDLEVFRSLAPFTNLQVVMDARLADADKEFGERLEDCGRARGFAVRLLRADDTAAGVLDQAQPGAAVYLTPALRMPDAEWQRLVDGLNAKKAPTFSMLGAADVERGVLAGLLPDAADLLARRVALNLRQIVMGAAPHDLPVALALDEKLTLNARTAVQIGFVCPIDLMLTARVLHQDALEQGETLTLEQAMQIALDSNVDISIKRAETESSRQERRKAASQLFPQVAGNAQYQQVNANQSEMSLGLLPEKKTSAGVGVTQLIFSDLAFSQYRAAHRQWERMRYLEDANRLDVAAAAGARFLQFLAAKALSRIDAENLHLTQSNLELTRVRFQAGAAGPEEVFRWEAQEARQRSALLASESKVEAGRVALNQSLGLDQERRWKTGDIPLANDDYYFLADHMRRRIRTDADLKCLERFAVQHALQHSPALKALDQAIEVQRIELAQLERKGYAPTVAASFSYDNILNDDYAGGGLSDQMKSAGLPALELPDRERNEWIATVQASLPLFEGGGRMADVARARSQLVQLRETRRRAAQLTEQEAHSVIYALESSQPNIALSRTGADRARNNLNVVRKKYAQGSVSILDLLDAQNQALTQDQAAAIAVNAYLQDIIQFQRVIAWFEFMKSAVEKEALISEMDAAWRPSAGAINAP